MILLISEIFFIFFIQTEIFEDICKIADILSWLVDAVIQFCDVTAGHNHNAGMFYIYSATKLYLSFCISDTVNSSLE